MVKFVFLLLSLICFNSFSGVIVVSDFDDTIKHTNVKNPVQIVQNVLVNRTIFSGMAHLLNSMSSYSYKTIILTGSPSILKNSIKKLLRSNKIKFDRLITNKTIKRPSTYNYKITALTEVLMNHPNDEFIFLGDDGGEDPEVYLKIKKLFPNQVKEIYIHVVQNRVLPTDVIPYATAFDIALWENHFDRLKTNNLKPILQEIHNREFKEGFPKFAYCPTDRSIWMIYPNTELPKEVLNYQNKVIDTCAANQLF